MKDGREDLIKSIEKQLGTNKATTSDFVDEIQKYAIWFLEWYDKSGFEIDAYSGLSKKMTSITLWNEFLNDIYDNLFTQHEHSCINCGDTEEISEDYDLCYKCWRIFSTDANC